MKRILYISLLLSGFSINAISQRLVYEPALWKLMSISGEIKTLGDYRIMRNDFSNASNTIKTSFLSGKLNLNLQSYVFHPKFLTLTTDIIYQPGKRRVNQLISFDHSETVTQKNIGLGASFFKDKPLNFNVFTRSIENYSNLEYLGHFKMKGSEWGGSFRYYNNILPLEMNYSNQHLTQNEMPLGRNFTFKQSTLTGKTTQSFTDYDKQNLNISYKNYLRQDNNKTPRESEITELRFNSNILLGHEKKYKVLSAITNYNRTGYGLNRRLWINEQVSIILNKNFDFLSNINYTKSQQSNQQSSIYGISSSLNHQLYSSLRTNLNFYFSKVDHSVYTQTNRNIGGSLTYQKKIPIGKILLSYNYNLLHRNHKSTPNVFEVKNETYVLVDGQVILLNQSEIDITSVVVKDETATLIYQLDVDYILIERNGFLEIQRIPGGLIPNNATVYIDYTTTSINSYIYDVANKSFSANIFLFNNLFQLYYNRFTNRYLNISMLIPNSLTLNSILRQSYGGRFIYDFVTIGIEFENYQSNIVPYKSTRYFVQLQKNLRNKVLLSMNGNRRYHHSIDNNKLQKYLDISGKMAYSFNKNTKFITEIGYQNQNGENIDLDLFRAKSEISTIFQQLVINVGFNMYKRVYVGQKSVYSNAFIEISRKF